MTLQEIQVALQALAAFAIAGGLIFTAIQFRSWRKAQHFANFSKLVEMQMHLREMRVSDPSLAEVYQHDVVGVDGERGVREYFFNLMQISVFEIVWYGWRHGQVTEDYFRSWESRMREIAVEKSFLVMWASPSMKIMHDDFHAYMQEVLRSMPAHTSCPAP